MILALNVFNIMFISIVLSFYCLKPIYLCKHWGSFRFNFCLRFRNKNSLFLLFHLFRTWYQDSVYSTLIKPSLSFFIYLFSFYFFKHFLAERCSANKNMSRNVPQNPQWTWSYSLLRYWYFMYIKKTTPSLNCFGKLFMYSQINVTTEYNLWQTYMFTGYESKNPGKK